MSLAATATPHQPRRRSRSSTEPVLPVDARRRRSAGKRTPKEATPNPAVDYGWPDGFVPAGITAVMLSITVLHHQALLDAVRSLIGF